MPAHFNPRNVLGAEIRRVLRHQLADAARRATGPETLADRVHAARTASKRLRAALRLLKSEAPEFVAVESGWLRALARQLAASREAEVRVIVLDSLQTLPPDRAAAAALRRIRARLTAERAAQRAAGAGVERVLAGFARRARAADRRTAVLELDANGFGLVFEGFAKTYRRARRAFFRARVRKGGPAVHDWRKAAKAHSEHCRLLQAARPKALKRRHRELAALCVLLGTHHDLENLRDHLKANPAVARSDGDFALRHIARRQEALLTAALRTGRRLFAAKPRSLRNRVRAGWKAASR